MPREKPASIRVEVPTQHGPAYDGEDGRQWVERRQRVSGKALLALEGLAQKLSDEKAFEEICKVLADIFTDWNLESDRGPLPKPWNNPKAFAALFDSDFMVLVWVGTLPFLSVGDLFESKTRWWRA